jgi:eukaryotic-like serine/threonine-protein kinase
VSTTDEKGHDSDPLIGQHIAENRYKIVKVIGEGGMGKVYLGEQKLGDRVRPVAIKTLQPDLAGDPQIIARFHREAGTVSLLDHPNTIKFYESGELPDHKLFVAMEFIQGESLAHNIARGPIAPQRIEHILQQVCGSLAEAHEHGIVHRDLKPENIILTQKGSKGDFVKVLDFGIAKRDESSDAQDAKLTRQGMVLGTPPYMSPEQFTGQPLRATSDVYSLAIVVYEMLTGHLPFVASTPWEWATKHLTAPPVPFEMHANGSTILPRHKAAVMRALAKEPAQRPQGVIDFLKEFTGDTGAGADWAVSTNQGHSSSNQGQIPPTAMVPQHPSMPGSNPGGPMVPQTMAVNYPTPTPFNPSSNPNFMQPSNQGYTPAPSNAGFNPVQPPPSNPGFAPVSGQGYAPNPYGSLPNPYGSQPGGYNAQPPQRSGGSGKIIAGVVALVVIVGGVAAFALGGNNSNNNNNNNNTANTANTTPTPVPVPQPSINPIAQPAGPTPTLPTAPQVPGPTITAIPNPPDTVPANNNSPDPPDQDDPADPPATIRVVRPTRPTSPPRPSCGRESAIDDHIISGRCSQAQALYRQLRAAGCRISASDHFGSACAAP